MDAGKKSTQLFPTERLAANHQIVSQLLMVKPAFLLMEALAIEEGV